MAVVPVKPSALAVVHDADAAVARAEIGTVGEAFTAAGYDLTLVAAGPGMPDPAGADAVVVFGSMHAAYDDTVPWLAPELAFLTTAIRVGTPTLGICFGGQILARALGGTVRRADRPELGWYTVDTDDATVVPAGPWLEFHFDTFTVPPGTSEIARTVDAPQAFTAGPHLGVQFHPEITVAAFETWIESWRATGFDARLPSLGVDLERLRAEVAAQADHAARRAGELVDAFLNGAHRRRPAA